MNPIRRELMTQEKEAPPGGGPGQMLNYHSITKMREYEAKSYEELRYEDYAKKTAGGSPAATTAFGAAAPATTSPFGAPAAAATPFGAPAAASPFGAPAAAPASPFGAPAGLLGVPPGPALGELPSPSG